MSNVTQFFLGRKDESKQNTIKKSILLHHQIS